MSDDNAKDEKPRQADDFTIINPPNTLASKVKKASGTLDDLLKNADKMLTNIQFEFETLMEEHAKQLTIIYTTQWTKADKRAEAVAGFSEIVNSIKGKAGTFNYALLGKIADLFRDYLKETIAEEQKAAAVLSYINAIQVVWKQKITADGGALGKAMVADLMKLNQKLTSGSHG